MTQSGSMLPTALGWVREDLDKLLEKIRLQVESIASHPMAGKTAFEAVATDIENLSLTLATLGADGPRQVTAQMLATVQALTGEDAPDKGAASEALMDALVVLPAYLDRLQAGHQDLPVLLLPLINTMRKVSGDAQLSEGTVFTPLLDVELPELDFVRKPGFDEPFDFFNQRLQRQYENALQNWLQEPRNVDLLSPIHGICETIRHRVERYDLKRLWWVATEVFGGLMDNHVINDVDLRRLMARLSLLIGTMATDGEDGIDERTSSSVTQALLYHIGKAKPGCEGVDLVRERFELDELAPDSDAMMRAKGTLSGQDREMYQSLSAAVQDELSLVKDYLDLELRTGQTEDDQRDQIMEALARLRDTLGMLGLSGPGESINRLIPSFEATATSEPEEREPALVGLAEELLLVESSLNEQIDTLGEPQPDEVGESHIALSPHELRRIKIALLDECVTGIHQAQDAFRESLVGNADADPVPLLMQVTGALRLSNLFAPATQSEKTARLVALFMQHRARGNEARDGEVENIADALAAMELILAASRDQQSDAVNQLAGTLEDRLQRAEPPVVRKAAQPAAETKETEEETTAEAAPEQVETPELPEAAPEEPDAAAEAPVTEQIDTTDPETPEEFTRDISADEDQDTLPLPIDPELRDIFLEEYESVLQSLQEAIPLWMNQMDQATHLTDIRRAFHTLKGSGRMVGADELGDFSWQIEEMLNSLLEGKNKNFGDASVLVRLAEASLPALRQRLLQDPAGLTGPIIREIGDAAEALSRDASIDWPGLRNNLPVYLAGLVPGGLDDPSASEQGDTDEEQAMLRNELSEHLGPIRELMDSIAQDRKTVVNEDQVRAMHTIVGALGMYPEALDAEVARSLENLLAAQSNSGKAFTPDSMFTLISAVGQIQNRLDRLDGVGDLTSEGEQQELIGQLDQLTPQFEGPAMAAPAASKDEESSATGKESGEFDPGISVFGGGSTQTDADSLDFESSLDSTDEPPLVPAEQHAEPAPEEQTVKVEEVPSFVRATPPPAPEERPTEPPSFDRPAPVESPAFSRPVAESTPEPESTRAAKTPPGLDQEIVEIFLEEASEVLARSDAALNDWRDNIDDLSWVQHLQREIHTFKGGARMSGLNSIGDFSHEMETLLERIAGKLMPPSLNAVEILEDACDRLQLWVDQVATGKNPDASKALTLLLQQIQGLTGEPQSPEAEHHAEETFAAEPTVESAPEGMEETETPLAEDLPASEPIEPAPVEPSPVAAAPLPAATSAPEFEAVAESTGDPSTSGSIKVPADLLDKLVNASGEVSIFRSRLEQQVGNLKGNVNEFSETIGRLSEQFRKMDIEIEAQIRSNYPDQSGADDENFDPLELDQFSALQQATRSLQESVSDLMSLQEMAEENVRASEQLLTRQSRVSTELQEGLMKTRMVPFGSIAPRLRRIIRGAAKEEAKQARLQLRMVGTSDELDRNVLEHITAPLEHMMRNAIVHGIEKPNRRREFGKPEEGEITITVESEATEFVIRIADDGAGIGLDAIKQRAIERGLLDADAEPSREQLYDFMMDSGFSTSDAVTRLAGRGVGMDVVSSDIKQIGGSLEIDSEPGEGTQFTIRIPFTLAIMQAIGVQAGDGQYLLPLSSVVGVSRILPAEYTQLMAEENPIYKFAGQEYPIFDIEPMLGERATPLSRDNISLLVLRAGEQKAAIRVADLLPHREVVIKPVGPQISSVAGVLGGSISGDGDVVVILDPGPMIRHTLIHGVGEAADSRIGQGSSDKQLVIVVDDSITMRKVTSRVLDNHNYEVITARDGVDALEKLQDRTPDIMLFDIEMPRMDGYELTERVRTDSRFRNTPIMMITSRAGKKHQDRAMQAGATAYLTKPYREDELIQEVERLLLEQEIENV